MAVPWRHGAQKQCSTEHTVYFKGILRAGRCVETESRRVVARPHRKGMDCLLQTGFPFGGLRMFWTQIEGCLHNTVDATELFTAVFT